MPQIHDPQTFASLYEAYARGVYASAYRVLRRAQDAEDVTQEVFLRLWSDPERFDPKRGELGAYLRLMARSRALDLWRHDQSGVRARERVKLLAQRDEVDPDELPAAAAERAEQAIALRSAVERLPGPQREAVALTYWGGLSPDQVARRSGIPFGTARSRVRLALGKLRRDCAALALDA